MKTVIIVLAMVILPFAHAHKKGVKKVPECKSIAEACDKAGYPLGGRKKLGEGKGMADCVKKIAQGEKIDTVTNTADEAKACIAARKAANADKDGSEE